MAGAEIRQELGSVLDQLNGDISLDERLALSARREELRSMIQAEDIDGADEIRAQWSERAASKPDEDPERSVIASPSGPG